MFVDIRVKTTPSYKVAHITHVDPYSGRNMWRAEFNQLVRWAKKRKLRTGKWIMYFIDEWGKRPERKRRSVACLEIEGNAKPDGKVKIMTLPRQRVASVPLALIVAPTSRYSSRVRPGNASDGVVPNAKPEASLDTTAPETKQS